jgi:hypothetical protein
MLLAESASSLFNSRRRTLHDQLAGTYVLDAARSFPHYAQRFQTVRSHYRDQSVTLEVEDGWDLPEEETSTVNGVAKRLQLLF